MTDKTYTSVLAVLEPPSTWHHNWVELLTNFRQQLPIVDASGRKAPLSTYLLFLLSKPDKNYCAYLNSIMCITHIPEFQRYLEELKQDATVIACTDDSNFQQELSAFGDIEKAVEHPHLYISPLFRYIMAMHMSYDFLVDDDLYNEAQNQLRKNPYFFTTYGPEFIDYMPLLWEEI